MKTIFLLLLLSVSGIWAETHVFWDKAIEKSYALSDSPGPNLHVLPQNIHQGTLSLQSYKQLAEWGTFVLGKTSPVGYMLPFNSIIYSDDLQAITGVITSATLRAEYRDYYSVGLGESNCLGGTLSIQRFVAEYSPSSYAFPPVVCSPYTASIAECFFIEFAWCATQTEWYAMDTVEIVAPHGQVTDISEPVLARQFMNIDITPQVQWIFDHNDTTHDFHYIIGLRTLADNGARISVYGFTNCDTVFLHQLLDYTPWTQDGNTGHIVVEGDLNPVTKSDQNAKSGNRTVWLTNGPNPFNPTTTIAFNLARNEKALLSIYTVSGRLVHSIEVLGSSYCWHANGLSSGVYICTLKNERMALTRRMLLCK